MMRREYPKDTLSARSELHVHLAPIGNSGLLGDEALCRQPIHQFDGAVMLNLQSLSETGDAGILSFRHPFHSEHKLMLLGLQSDSTSRFLTKSKKAPNLVAEFRYCLVLRLLEIQRAILVLHNIYRITIYIGTPQRMPSAADCRSFFGSSWGCKIGGSLLTNYSAHYRSPP